MLIEVAEEQTVESVKYSSRITLLESRLSLTSSHSSSSLLLGAGCHRGPVHSVSATVSHEAVNSSGYLIKNNPIYYDLSIWAALNPDLMQ